MAAPAYELAPCPVCGAAESTEVAGAEDIREEVEALWEFHTARLAPDTPPLRLLDRVAFSQHPPLRVVRCAGCGLVYRNPRERARTLEANYETEAPDDAALEALFETQRAAYRAQVERLTSQLGRAGSGLEVGSYVGGFLAAAAEAGWHFEGVDVNEHAAAFARARGLRVTIGELSAVPASRRVDAVAIWNCFDQLAEPRSTLHEVRARLVEHGLLAIRVPNGGFYATVRKALDGPAARAARALLAHNNLLTFPYRFGFTPDSLSLLLRQTGFEVLHVHGDALVPVADEWTRRWAAVEERALKSLLRALAAARAEDAPWFEIYARAGTSTVQSAGAPGSSAST